MAVIMDGNGRWAKARGLPRVMGHREGVKALKRTVEAAPRMGVECLTVFGFSTENWSRPAGEVAELMGLIRSYLSSDLERMEREGVRLRVLGRREGLPADIVRIIDRAEARTSGNRRFLLQVAFNYGARADIVAAAQRHAERVLAGESPAALDEAGFGRSLSSAGAPDVDLIIRTSGEQRLSNFLLWEAAYAEFVFQDVLWPDYGEIPLGQAVETFRQRERRFGGVEACNVAAAG